MAWLLAALCLIAPQARSQDAADNQDPKLAAEEKEACISNLNVIRQAIQAYWNDHKEIPNWLSDLVPQYINDPNVLICPVCKRTGRTEMPSISDPKIPCSYLYEFCPVPLLTNKASGVVITHRDWKRRQMEIVGPMVPIVRCRHHLEVLNLAFDGRIYDSPSMWESLLTNKMDINLISWEHLYSDVTAANEARPKPVIPPRDPATSPALIDLTPYYNAALNESWHEKNRKNDLSSLPTGIQEFAGVKYDVRGLIQVTSKAPGVKGFPLRVNGIKIGQKCERIHFLHAVVFGTLETEGMQVGSYIIHYATNKMQLEIPIVCGRDVRDWHSNPNETPSDELTVAWTGTNEISAQAHRSIRLFTTTWVNIAPDVEIKSIDFVSAMRHPAPFLVAVTLD